MPLRIIIDGYNLMGIFHRDLEKERSLLIEKLIKYHEVKKHQIVLVFDGHKSREPDRKILDRGGIKIIYTRFSETADDFISSFIKDFRFKWIVVSSDRSVQREAWSNNCIPIDAEDFEKVLTKAINENINGSVIEKEEREEDNNIYERINRKGNPRQPSKKQKAVIRIMKDL